MRPPFLVHLVTPTLREALFALSYLAVAVAVAVIMQQSFGPRANSVRLDGIIAGLALASLASMFGFRQSVEISGRSLLAEFNLFNPILVIVLLVLLGAGLVPKHFRTDLTTSLLIVGLAIIAAGDDGRVVRARGAIHGGPGGQGQETEGQRGSKFDQSARHECAK